LISLQHLKKPPCPKIGQGGLHLIAALVEAFLKQLRHLSITPTKVLSKCCQQELNIAKTLDFQGVVVRKNYSHSMVAGGFEVIS